MKKEKYYEDKFSAIMKLIVSFSRAMWERQSELSQNLEKRSPTPVKESMAAFLKQAKAEDKNRAHIQLKVQKVKPGSPEHQATKNDMMRGGQNTNGLGQQAN